MESLTGRTAVVTGAASGLGKAMAETFAREGMRLVLADIEEAPLEAVRAELAAAGTEVVATTVDVSKVADLERLADLAFTTFGNVHVLCNNAGVNKRARLWEFTEDDWNWVLDVDLWGVIHGVRIFLPRMIANGEPGHIVNTGSMAGLLPIRGLGAYAVAKSGVVSLSEVLSLDLEAVGAPIGVSVLCPGYIATRIGDSDRNRPAELAAAAPAPNGPRTSAGVVPTMTAEHVAAEVLDAVQSDRFWILTHQDYREIIQTRAAGIGTDAHPEMPPIW